MSKPDSERRKHKRHKLEFPVVLQDAGGKHTLRAKAVNISDGGALVKPTAPANGLDGDVSVNLRIPRQTPNTFMFEDFFVNARVVRNHPHANGEAIAIQFVKPLLLDLEM
jgi:c-di-GMP-binding flagellar brake protein YcgR